METITNNRKKVIERLNNGECLPKIVDSLMENCIYGSEKELQNHYWNNDFTYTWEDGDIDIILNGTFYSVYMAVYEVDIDCLPNEEDGSIEVPEHGTRAYEFEVLEERPADAEDYLKELKEFVNGGGINISDISSEIETYLEEL